MEIKLQILPAICLRMDLFQAKMVFTKEIELNQMVLRTLTLNLEIDWAMVTFSLLIVAPVFILQKFAVLSLLPTTLPSFTQLKQSSAEFH